MGTRSYTGDPDDGLTARYDGSDPAPEISKNGTVGHVA